MVNTEYACLTTDDLISYVLNKTEDSLLVELAQRLQLASDMLEEADEMGWLPKLTAVYILNNFSNF